MLLDGPVTDVVIKYFRGISTDEIVGLATRYTQLGKTQRRLGYLVDSGRRAEYLGLDRTGFHSTNNWNRALENLELGLELICEQELVHQSFKLKGMKKRIRENMPEALWQYNIIFCDQIAASSLTI